MSHLVIWAIAYLFTGFSYMTRDASMEPAWNRPRYVQSNRSSLVVTMNGRSLHFGLAREGSFPTQYSS